MPRRRKRRNALPILNTDELPQPLPPTRIRRARRNSLPGTDAIPVLTEVSRLSETVPCMRKARARRTSCPTVHPSGTTSPLPPIKFSPKRPKTPPSALKADLFRELHADDFTNCQEAIERFEIGLPMDKTAPEMRIVKLHGVWPPIREMDSALNQLVCCEHLHLSSNRITKVGNLSGLWKLRTLSLARNCIDSLEDASMLGETNSELEELQLSYNSISNLRGVESLSSLKILDLGNNQISKLEQLQPLTRLQNLRDLTLANNPIHLDGAKKYGAGAWAGIIFEMLPQIERLDGTMACTWKKMMHAAHAQQLRRVFTLITAHGGTNSPRHFEDCLLDPAICAAVLTSARMKHSGAYSLNSLCITPGLVKKKLRRVFELIDTKGDGVLDQGELTAALETPGLRLDQGELTPTQMCVEMRWTRCENRAIWMF